jgi:hypothetical protein
MAEKGNSRRSAAASEAARYVRSDSLGLRIDSAGFLTKGAPNDQPSGHRFSLRRPQRFAPFPNDGSESGSESRELTI